MKIIIDNNEFEEIIKNDKVVVDFFAEWCGPCRMLSPHFEEASKLAPNVNFVKVDVDKASEIAKKYEIYSIPTIIYFEKGEIKNRIQGFVNVDTILKSLK